MHVHTQNHVIDIHTDNKIKRTRLLKFSLSLFYPIPPFHSPTPPHILWLIYVFEDYIADDRYFSVTFSKRIIKPTLLSLNNN